jgi:hypothetical protein
MFVFKPTNYIKLNACQVGLTTEVYKLNFKFLGLVISESIACGENHFIGLYYNEQFNECPAKVRQLKLGNY